MKNIKNKKQNETLAFTRDEKSSYHTILLLRRPAIIIALARSRKYRGA